MAHLSQFIQIAVSGFGEVRVMTDNLVRAANLLALIPLVFPLAVVDEIK
jgi:hypothetical protein